MYVIHTLHNSATYTQIEPGIERVQALANISRSGYVVIATKTAPIANPLNIARLWAPSTICQVRSGSVH